MVAAVSLYHFYVSYISTVNVFGSLFLRECMVPVWLFYSLLFMVEKKQKEATANIWFGVYIVFCFHCSEISCFCNVSFVSSSFCSLHQPQKYMFFFFWNLVNWCESILAAENLHQDQTDVCSSLVQECRVYQRKGITKWQVTQVCLMSEHWQGHFQQRKIKNCGCVTIYSNWNKTNMSVTLWAEEELLPESSWCSHPKA